MAIYNSTDSLGNFEDAVLTYGHFNTIHPGHIRYLSYAKELGKNLIVALRGDKVINGKKRFQFSIEERSEALNHLYLTDHIICLKEDELSEVVRKIEPKIIVFGREFETNQDQFITRAIKIQKNLKGKILFHAGDIKYASTELLSGTKDELSKKRRRQFLTAIERQKLNKNILLKSIDSLKDANLIILGDTILDQFAACEPLGLSAEAPVIVVKELERKNYIGGAAIVASHIRALGAKCEFISVIGNDNSARTVKDLLDRMDINSELIIDNSRPTTFKKRYVVENQKLFRVSRLEDHSLDPKIEKKLISVLRKKAKEVNGIVISDFVYGVITEKILEEIIKLSDRYGLLLFGDLQCSSQVGSVTKFKNFSLITPNEREARIALQDKNSGLELLSNKLISLTNSERLIMKLGADGFIAYDRNKEGDLSTQSFPALSVNPVDVSGAGDSLLAVMATGLSSKQSMMATSALGCLKASLAVESMGNIPISNNSLITAVENIFE